MAIESIGNSINASASYQVQGSRESSAPTPSVSPAAEIADSVQSVNITENSNRDAKDGEGKDNFNDNRQPSNESVQKAVALINKQLTNSKAVFGIHEETNRLTIKMVDKDTDKVIKEFPADETLDMLAKVMEFAGLMVDEKR